MRDQIIWSTRNHTPVGHMPTSAFSAILYLRPHEWVSYLNTLVGAPTNERSVGLWGLLNSKFLFLLGSHSIVFRSHSAHGSVLLGSGDHLGYLEDIPLLIWWHLSETMVLNSWMPAKIKDGSHTTINIWGFSSWFLIADQQGMTTLYCFLFWVGNVASLAFARNSYHNSWNVLGLLALAELVAKIHTSSELSNKNEGLPYPELLWVSTGLRLGIISKTSFFGEFGTMFGDYQGYFYLCT